MITASNPVIIHWTRDMSTAIAFYRDVFGLPVSVDSSYLSVLELTPIQLLLHIVDDDQTGGPLPNAGLNLEVADLDAAVELVERHGGRLVDIVQPTPPAHIRIAILSDPDGNVFEFRQYIGHER